MRMERYELSTYNEGRLLEAVQNKLKGAIHVHVVDAPYNSIKANETRDILIYAFYSDRTADIAQQPNKTRKWV